MEGITVRLFASLREYAPGDSCGVIDMGIKEGSKIEDIISELDIPRERVKMIMLNGRASDSTTRVTGGDRVALFPPEVAFNLYVAMNFREDLRWKGG